MTVLLNYHIGCIVLGSMCGWVGVVSVLQAEAQHKIIDVVDRWLHSQKASGWR